MKANKLLHLQRHELRDFSRANTIPMALYSIYQETIDPSLPYDMFELMYCSKELMYIDFTMLMCGEKRARFSAAFFYRTTINEKTIFIARSATGLVEEYQGKGVHNVYDLYSKFMRFARRHPFAPKYVAAFVISPFVYSELCRFVPQFYPKPDITVPQNIEILMDEIVTRGGWKRCGSACSRCLPRTIFLPFRNFACSESLRISRIYWHRTLPVLLR